jgi:hypothetical protein
MAVVVTNKVKKKSEILSMQDDYIYSKFFAEATSQFRILIYDGSR